MRIYVVMLGSDNPIAIASAKMHSAYKTRKEARKKCETLKQRAARNHYWVESVKVESQQ